VARDFAPPDTNRYRLRYRVLGKGHNLTVRPPNTHTIADASATATKLHAFLEAIKTHLYNDFTIVNAQWCDRDSEVFLPCEAPAPTTGGVSTSGITGVAGAISMGFVGRGSAGSKAGFYLYGHNYDVPVNSAAESDFRLTASEIPVVAAAITALSELAPAFVAIDGSPVMWYPYVNLKYNDRWVRKLRQG